MSGFILQIHHKQSDIKIKEAKYLGVPIYVGTRMSEGTMPRLTLESETGNAFIPLTLSLASTCLYGG